MLLDIAMPSPFEEFVEGGNFILIMSILVILTIILTIFFIWRNRK